MRVLTAAQMREADRRTIEEAGIPSIALMENAGHQIVSAMHATIDDLESRRVGILCGRGNNGGDGFVVARLLSQQGLPVYIYLLGGAEDVGGDAGTNLRVAQSLGCRSSRSWIVTPGIARGLVSTNATSWSMRCLGPA